MDSNSRFTAWKRGTGGDEGCTSLKEGRKFFARPGNCWRPDLREGDISQGRITCGLHKPETGMPNWIRAVSGQGGSRQALLRLKLYFVITGKEEKALVPMKRSAVAAMLVLETQSMVPRLPVSFGN